MQLDLISIDLPALLRALEHKLQAEQLTETTWRVSSYSRPDHWWSLYADDLGVDCDCPAGQYDRSCQHAALVIALRAGELRVRHGRRAGGHVGPCGARCGALPLWRVAVYSARSGYSVCLVDPDQHEGCAATLRLLPAVRRVTATRPSVA